MDDLFLLGRLVFGSYFIYSGANHFLMTATMAQYAGSKGVPMPEAAVIVAGLLLLAGGFSILLGFLPHVGVACIVLFLAVVTPTMHDFWNAPAPALRMAEMANFLKNLALLGGTLTLLGVPRPWPYSVESRRRIAV